MSADADSVDWKELHANESMKALDHPLVAGVMEEYADNMNFDPKVGLPAYGMMKVAMYAAQVARAQALGFDPDMLRMSRDEANSALWDIAAEAVFAGVPTTILDESAFGPGGFDE
jgi:hypothetical protein